ncbi:hypothetical protein KM043_016797 [Ampulex compressa]|nr:hypothetical protein KM043_016797 [Ampulex compressa]
MSAIFRLIRLQGLKQGITYVTPQRIPSRTINTSSKKNEIKKQTQSFEPKKTWLAEYSYFRTCPIQRCEIGHSVKRFCGFDTEKNMVYLRLILT